MTTEINAKAFYDSIKKSHFSGRLGQKQFEGIETILKEGARRNLPLNQLAYILATPAIETGNTYQPIAERGAKSYFNKYDIRYNPRKARELGNLTPGDGYKYRGRGHVQTTGLANHQKFRAEVLQKFGVDIVANPDAIIGNTPLSVYLMFEGMLRGVYTGKKLSTYLTPTKSDYYNARQTVNGLDRARDLSNIAKKFEAALKAAGYQQDPNREVEVDPMLDGMLYLGDRGPAVFNYGTDLNYLGYGPLVGNVYNPSFVAATRRLQKDGALEIDGKAGPKTLAYVAKKVSEKALSEKPKDIPVSTVGERIPPLSDSNVGSVIAEHTSTDTPRPDRDEWSSPEPPKSHAGKITFFIAAIVAGAIAIIEPARNWVISVWISIFG